MSEITVTVTGTPPDGSYDSPSSSVGADGTITVEPGTTTIRFVSGSGQTWRFQSPWIGFQPDGPFSVTAGNPNQVVVVDQDPGGDGATYEYTLYTTEGDFDPEIINKGGG